MSRLAVAPGGGSRSPAVAALTSAATPRLADLAPEQALRRLELTVLRRLDGLLQGDHLGLLPGPGSEPAEARAYRPGEDDVRRIDWSVTARTAVTHVRDATADRELETWVLVDRSASMDFGTARMEKRDLAVAAVASVGFLTARDGNRLGCHLLHHGTTARVPARQGRQALLALLRLLLGAPRTPWQSAPTPGLAQGLTDLDRQHRRRGLRVVVSDFVDTPYDGGPPSWARPLRRLAARHQVLVVEVLDPRELELPDVGLLTVVDPETGRRREVQTSKRRLREEYARAAAAQRATVRAAVRRAGAGHLVLRTDRDWVLDVARFAARQRSLAAAAPVSRRTR